MPTVTCLVSSADLVVGGLGIENVAALLEERLQLENDWEISEVCSQVATRVSGSVDAWSLASGGNQIESVVEELLPTEKMYHQNTLQSWPSCSLSVGYRCPQNKSVEWPKSYTGTRRFSLEDNIEQGVRGYCKQTTCTGALLGPSYRPDLCDYSARQSGANWIVKGKGANRPTSGCFFILWSR